MRTSLVLILIGAAASSGAQSRIPSPDTQLFRVAPPVEQPGRASADTTYDIVIRNGRVLDGEGTATIVSNEE